MRAGRCRLGVRLATIDLGSNTVRLLVVDTGPPADRTGPAAARAAPAVARSGPAADRTEGAHVSWTIVEHDQQVTRLGEGLAARGSLGEMAMARTCAVVERYVSRGVHAGACDVTIVATSAVREAPNGAAFAADIEARTGRRVRVIGGDEEARLTLRGIQAGLGRASGRIVAFDIGGGSTEYIRADDGVPRAAVSLRLGVVSLAEDFPFPHRVDLATFAALRDGVLAHLRTALPREIRESRPDRLIGTAGTATTLAALDLGLARYDAARVQGHVLSRAAITVRLDALAALTLDERAALPPLERGRADLILPGIAIVLATLECLGVDAMQVSDWGIREGIIAEMIDATR
jgi:exopolyphosphatase/guanosine-5'-triphosphate,3'-diphosphate pyrophosphatase